MSSVWYHTFDSQFWIIIGGLCCAFLTILAKIKCTRVECCGIVVERNVAAELAAERNIGAATAAQRPLPRIGTMGVMSPSPSTSNGNGRNHFAELDTALTQIGTPLPPSPQVVRHAEL